MTCPRAYLRRIFAGVAVAACALPFVYQDRVVHEKNLFALWIPAFGALGAALLLPYFWRASGGTRFAALAYLGGPVGALLAMPLSLVPAAQLPFVAAALVVAAAVTLFYVEASAAVEVDLETGTIAQGGRRFAIAEVTGLVWDAVSIETRGTFSTSTSAVARIVLFGPDRRRIELDTTNHRGAGGLISGLRDAACRSLVERIGEAVAAGETVRAGPLRFGPDGMELRRPRGWSMSELVVVFAVLGVLPVVIAVKALADQAHFDPRPLLILSPLAIVGAILVIDRLRRRTPLHFAPGTESKIADGKLLLPRGKRTLAIELRFLENGLIVPPLLTGRPAG